MVPISLEFFPPKTPEGAAKLGAARQRLYALTPEFCSVTFGAGGSTQDGTLQAVVEIIKQAAAASMDAAFLPEATAAPPARSARSARCSAAVPEAQVIRTVCGAQMPIVRALSNPFGKLVSVSTVATPLGHFVRASIGVAATRPKTQVDTQFC